jgi:Uma2 family endonuclease
MVNLVQTPALATTPQQLDQNPEPKTLESRVTLEGVSWLTFQTLLAEVGENRSSRFTYDQGVLEIRMPLQAHEEPLGMIESAIEALADELGLEIKKLGATSLKRADLKRFVEPDTCFYIQHEAEVRQKSAIDLAIDPPPDLAIESDYTNSSLPKFSLYAALGVPELWHYQQQTLEIYLLVEGNYERSQTSLAFPSLPVAEIPQLIEQSKAIGQRAAIRLFREKIRAIALK